MRARDEPLVQSSVFLALTVGRAVKSRGVSRAFETIVHARASDMSNPTSGRQYSLYFAFSTLANGLRRSRSTMMMMIAAAVSTHRWAAVVVGDGGGRRRRRRRRTAASIT